MDEAQLREIADRTRELLGLDPDVKVQVDPETGLPTFYRNKDGSVEPVPPNIIEQLSKSSEISEFLDREIPEVQSSSVPDVDAIGADVTQSILNSAFRRLDRVPTELDLSIDDSSMRGMEQDIMAFLEDGHEYVKSMHESAALSLEKQEEAASKMGVTTAGTSALVHYSSMIHEPYIQSQAKLMGITEAEYKSVSSIVANRMADLNSQASEIISGWGKHFDAEYEETFMWLVQDEAEIRLRELEQRAQADAFEGSAQDEITENTAWRAEQAAAQAAAAGEIAMNTQQVLNFQDYLDNYKGAS